ncbi:MAG TPA: TetR/AcrR family transcriptional regulator [Ktedonobacterales bacterium]|jgi:AcrR family transcriptional regulator|nr:TetR/AcrR family transcriptional regulator [Ktedonobacterales bacterium]
MADIDEVPTRNGAAPLIPATPRGEATRRRLLDAAEEVFGEMGYYEASVSEITRRAGVAQGTFYIYFHSKRETFVELVEDIGERLRAATSVAIQDTSDRIAAERKGFEAFFRFVYEHRRIYRIVEEAGRVAPEAAREYYRRIGLGYERGLSAAMSNGQLRPTNAEGVEGLAYALMGIGHFLALRWLIWPSEDERERAQSGEASSQPLAAIPDAVFETVMTFIARGLEADHEPR